MEDVVAAARDVCAVRGVRDAISGDDENDGMLVPVLLRTTLGSYSCALSGQGLSWDGPSVAARVVVVRWRRDATTYNLPPRGWRRNSSRAVPRTIARGAVDDISRGIARARSSVTRDTNERGLPSKDTSARYVQEKPNSIPTPSLSKPHQLANTQENSRSPSSSIAARSLESTPESLGSATRPLLATSRIP